MEFLQSLYSLEINGCNEITEQVLWSSLHPRLISLTLTDCINVADECICAITQLLPTLYEFNLQAYHVTDSALSYFSPKQTGTLNVLRLQSCWEITNHGLVNIGKISLSSSFSHLTDLTCPVRNHKLKLIPLRLSSIATRLARYL